ncbi:MAG: hypothetical protein ACLT98_13915 [Eggerthellaceae bacterium]
MGETVKLEGYAFSLPEAGRNSIESIEISADYGDTCDRVTTGTSGRASLPTVPRPNLQSDGALQRLVRCGSRQRWRSLDHRDRIRTGG